MLDKVTVYIVSMGNSSEEVGEFVGRFSARFGIPEPKLLALSRRLPGKIGSYDADKAKLIGIEIKRMGGQVSLRRETMQQPEPIPAPEPAADEGDQSWLVHGHGESQDELVSMTRTGTEAGLPSSTVYDFTPSPGEEDRPPATLPPERKIAGKYEAKQIYTIAQSRGMDEEHFQKMKALYADRKERRHVTQSPIFRIGLVIVFLLLAVYLYMERQTILARFAGIENVTLTDVYEYRLPSKIVVGPDLTGSYSGEMKYTTKAGDISYVGVTLFVDGRNVHDVVVDISSSSAEVGKYQLKIEYAPGYVKYLRTVNGKTTYAVESPFPVTDEAVARIDEGGRFSMTLSAIDAKIDPATVPGTEKDRLGNMLFLKMEGGYAGNDQFYGGLLTSSTPPMGWEAKKK